MFRAHRFVFFAALERRLHPPRNPDGTDTLPRFAKQTVNKFGPGGLMIVRAGGDAGMYSGIIGGWSAGGPRGSLPVTREVRS
jgi:hypothetical protein